MENQSTVFWDIKPGELDFKKQSNFVIPRVLEHGQLKDIKWLLKKYKAEKIKKVLCQSRNLSEKTANFWAVYFKISKEKILCLQKSYLKKRRIFWPY